MAVLTRVVICASLQYGFVSLTSLMRKTIIELVAGIGSRVIRYANVDLAWPADPRRQSGNRLRPQERRTEHEVNSRRMSL